LFDQESVFLDGSGEVSRTNFSQRVSKEDTTEFWIFGYFGLQAWDEGSGISVDSWVVFVHANEHVDDVTHLVERVELGKLFWNEELVSISCEILVEPNGEAILTSGWGS
jgi:hypothetical protein